MQLPSCRFCCPDSNVRIPSCAFHRADPIVRILSCKVYRANALQLMPTAAARTNVNPILPCTRLPSSSYPLPLPPIPPGPELSTYPLNTHNVMGTISWAQRNAHSIISTTECTRWNAYDGMHTMEWTRWSAHAGMCMMAGMHMMECTRTTEYE